MLPYIVMDLPIFGQLWCILVDWVLTLLVNLINLFDWVQAILENFGAFWLTMSHSFGEFD